MKHARIMLFLFMLVLYALSSLVSSLLMYILELAIGVSPFAVPVGFGLALRELLFIIIAFAFFLVMGYFMSKKTVKPFETLSEATQKVARGDFSVRVQEFKRPDELRHLQHNFNAMARELQQKDALQKDFIANVSHEYKSPIASIQGYTRLLMEEDTAQEDRQKYGGIILEESGRLLEMAGHIMDLSQLENRGIGEEPSDYWLDEQIRDTVLTMEPVWSKKNIEFDINLEQVKVTGYKDQYAQIWTNLINNAIKFSDPGTAVGISMYRAGDRIKITVADQGAGITEEALPHIFERFYQGETSRKNEGSGLGLAIVKQIVECSGGSISAAGSEGQGATFVVELPAVQDGEREN